MDPFVTAADLVGLPGAPFTESAVKAAVSQIRRLAGWHIAPSISEELIVDGSGAHDLWLPTRHVTGVTGVQIWTGDGWTDLEGWDPQTGWAQSGILSSEGSRFPDQRRSVKVALTHGYETAPEDLKLLTAVSTGRPVASESISSRSVTFADSGDIYGASGILASYSLGPRP